VSDQVGGRRCSLGNLEPPPPKKRPLNHRLSTRNDLTEGRAQLAHGSCEQDVTPICPERFETRKLLARDIGILESILCFCLYDNQLTGRLLPVFLWEEPNSFLNGQKCCCQALGIYTEVHNLFDVAALRHSAYPLVKLGIVCDGRAGQFRIKFAAALHRLQTFGCEA